MEELFFIQRIYIIINGLGVRVMERLVFINMENEILTGNLLDVGMDTYGIVYNLYKENNEEIAVDYINGSGEKKNIEENNYDGCVLLFSLRNIKLKLYKKKLVKDIYKFLKEDGNIYIWDIDKGINSVFNGRIRILLPNRKVKEIIIKDYNIFKNSSKESTVKLLKDYFEIVDIKASSNVYYIKGKKKGKKKDEGSISSN